MLVNGYRRKCWMKPMEVLLIIEGTYPWYRGGVSEWVHQYIKAFDEAIFHVVQISNDPTRDHLLSDALYPIPKQVGSFIRIPPPKLTDNWQADTEAWMSGIWDGIEPAAGGSDFIHVTNTGFAGWLGKELAAGLSKPLVLTEHALYWKEVAGGAAALECGYRIPQTPEKKRAFGQMFQQMAKAVYSEADTVISVSECNITEQQRLGAGEVHYIPNGVSGDWLLDAKPRLTDPLTIGWIGRCSALKAPLKFFAFVEAFNRIGRGEVQFIMLSCDAQEPQLAAQVKRQSRKYPNLRLIWNRSTREYIDQMDALCITSRSESQPLVLFEALSRKVLPIGWQTGDVTEKYGFIVDREIPEMALARKVVTFWDQQALWQQRVLNLQAVVASHHTWEKTFQSYHQLLSSDL